MRGRGIDVTTSQEARLLGEDDRHQLAYALAAGRDLVTHDNDHLRLHAQGVAHSGVVYCHRKKFRIGDLIRSLEELRERTESDDLAGRVHYL